MEQITVGLVQQNPLLIPYLQKVLVRSNMRVFSNEPALLGEILPGKPISVFLLDVGALTEPFLRYTQRLRSLHPKSKILLLGVKASRSPLLLMLTFGIHGFVSYQTAKASLINAIHAVVRNGLWFPPDILNQFTARPQQRRPRLQNLTKREKMIVPLIESRLSNREIAALANVSENTIKFHLSNIFRKLEVHDRQSVIFTTTISRELDSKRRKERGQLSMPSAVQADLYRKRPPNRIADASSPKPLGSSSARYPANRRKFKT